MSIRQTIRKILREDTQKTMVDLISKVGFTNAAKFTGGYDKLLRLLGPNLPTRDMKINALMNFVKSRDGWVNLNESDNAFAVEPEEDSSMTEHSIEYIDESGPVIVVYIKNDNSGEWQVIDEYQIGYIDLPTKVLNKLFELMVTESI
jgi:hypothetical protein